MRIIVFMLMVSRCLTDIGFNEKGDIIRDISFFATWSVFKIDGTVQHKTKIEEGEYKGCYILGIKSEETISNCRPECF
jgi:hypothetical protein